MQRWSASGAAERANYQLFLSELCDVIGVERPQPSTPDEAGNRYVFEKAVPLPYGSTGRIDLYKRGCFVLEAKQGSDDWDAPKPLSAAALGSRRGRKRGTAVRGTPTRTGAPPIVTGGGFTASRAPCCARRWPAWRATSPRWKRPSTASLCSWTSPCCRTID